MPKKKKNKHTKTHVHWVGDAIQPSHPCHPLLLPSIIPRIRVFSNESTLRMRWPKYWSFSFSIIPSNQHPGLISFRMDWLDLLAVQGILKSLLQHHSSKPSILWCSAFFIVQLSHPYMTTGKGILRPCSDSSATPSFPSQPEGKIGLPRANPRGRLRSRS